MKRIGILLLMFFMLLESLRSQDIQMPETTRFSPDSSYVFRYPHRLMLGLSFFLRTNSLSLTDMDSFGNEIVYKPNNPMKLGVTSTYKGVRLGLAFNLPSYLNNKGNTQSFTLYLNTQTRFLSWGIDFYYIKNQGYYLDNPELNIPEWTNRDEYPFRSDLVTTNFALLTHMVFSRKFSLKAAVHNMERQLKSAGGVAMQLGISTSSMMSDSSVVPETQLPYYESIKGMTEGQFVSLNIRPGYAYTYVHSGFYSTTVAYLGLGLQLQSYHLESGRYSAGQLSPVFKFNQLVGYNIDEAFVTISFSYESSSYNVRDVNFKNKFLAFSIGGGLRFI